MATSRHAPPKFETVLYRESAAAFVEKRKPAFKGR